MFLQQQHLRTAGKRIRKHLTPLICKFLDNDSYGID